MNFKNLVATIVVLFSFTYPKKSQANPLVVAPTYACAAGPGAAIICVGIGAAALGVGALLNSKKGLDVFENQSGHSPNAWDVITIGQKKPEYWDPYEYPGNGHHPKKDDDSYPESGEELDDLEGELLVDDEFESGSGQVDDSGEQEISSINTGLTDQLSTQDQIESETSESRQEDEQGLYELRSTAWVRDQLLREVKFIMKNLTQENCKAVKEELTGIAHSTVSHFLTEFPGLTLIDGLNDIDMDTVVFFPRQKSRCFKMKN